MAILRTHCDDKRILMVSEIQFKMQVWICRVGTSLIWKVMINLFFKTLPLNFSKEYYLYLDFVYVPYFSFTVSSFYALNLWVKYLSLWTKSEFSFHNLICCFIYEMKFYQVKLLTYLEWSFLELLQTYHSYVQCNVMINKLIKMLK